MGRTIKTAGDSRNPVVLSVLSDMGTPVSFFHKLAAGEDTAFLFESTEGDSRLARYSMIGVDPLKTIELKDGRARIVDRLEGKVEEREFSDPFALLKEVLAGSLGRLSPDQARVDGLPFTGGLVGYLGYGATAYFDGIPQQESDPHNVPDGYWGLYDSVVLFDHQFRRLRIVSHRGEAHARALLERVMQPGSLLPLADREVEIGDEDTFDGVSGPFGKEEFVAVVERAKEYIVEGQVFQIVVSHRFSLPTESEPLNIYRILQALNPSPYAYLLKCPGFSYLGSSPETFVKCQDGEVVLRALAGTRPRGLSEDEDERLARELKGDEKELAEHRMLVDLGRNDLGRVCRPGSIRVGEIATLTRYTHVMHLATEITGSLRDDRTCFDVFAGCFPRGTVSGAPKIRAMQLLAGLEPERRGIYSGVVGYFDLGGNMDGAIAIRSALIKDGFAHVNAGAGIVYDSQPASEYEETRNKARSVVKAIKLAALIKGADR